MNQNQTLFGAIEAGGTKFVCAVGNRSGDLLDQRRIDTRDPDTTLGEVRQYFESAQKRFGVISAVGVGSFGPLDLRPASPSFGFITSTPKPGWRNIDLRGFLMRSLGRPVYLDTDVNAAALAEHRWGAGWDLDSVAYVTVGTGIGVGLLHGGRPVHGLVHPELGHLIVRRHPEDRGFAGICPFHGDCLEGLASGPAIQVRTGESLERAAADAAIWDLAADYLGQLCATLVLSNSPQRILMGGGVMQQGRLFGAIQTRMHHWLRDYVQAAELHAEHYVRAPGLGTLAGIKGALSLCLAAEAA